MSTEAKTIRKKRQYIRRDDLPIVEHPLLRCEKCDWLKFKTRTLGRDPDGVVVQQRTCKKCGHRFVLIQE